MTDVAQNPGTLTLAQAARIMREALRDKSYQLTPLGAEIAGYLRIKRKRLAVTSYRTYESSLDKLARCFPDLELRDLEPPVGVQRIEEYLDRMWGDAAPGTYNRNLSITSDFFDFAVKRDLMRGNPCGPIEPASSRKASLRGRGCTRLATPPGSASSTPPAISSSCRSSSATSRSAPPGTSTWTTTSISGRRCSLTRTPARRMRAIRSDREHQEPSVHGLQGDDRNRTGAAYRSSAVAA